MKKLMLPMLLLITFIFITDIGHCEDNKVRLSFGNGVLNSAKDARYSLKVLMELLDNSLQGTGYKDKIAYDISHNPTDGLKDFGEAMEQIGETDWIQFWRYLAGLDIMPDSIQAIFKAVSINYDKAKIAEYPSIQKHVDKYNKRLCLGDKVVVVAHSQGNLFANIAYTGINENTIDGFGIVSVANPDSSVEGDGLYTTIDEDYIMALIPTAMPSNLDNFIGPVNLKEPFGHSFINSYMAEGRPAKTKILNDIVATIDKLYWPTGPCNEYLMVEASRKNGALYCFIWDLTENKMAENIPLDSGGYAVFPVLKFKISNWLSNKTSVGQNVFTQDSLSISNPEQLIPLNCKLDGEITHPYVLECTDTGSYEILDFPDHNGTQPLEATADLFMKSEAPSWESWYNQETRVWNYPVGGYGFSSLNCMPLNNFQKNQSITIDLTIWSGYFIDFHNSSVNIEEFKGGREYKYTIHSPFDSNQRSATVEKNMKSYKYSLLDFCDHAYERNERLEENKIVVSGNFSDHHMFVLYGWEAWKSGQERFTTYPYYYHGLFVLKNNDRVDVPGGHVLEPFSERFYTEMFPLEINCFYKTDTISGTQNMDPFNLPPHFHLTKACNDLQTMVYAHSPLAGPGKVKLADFEVSILK